MTTLQHLRTLRKQAQFPYGPQSLYQHAPEPPPPAPPTPQPAPDPNIELQTQLEQTGAQVQQLTEAQQKAQAELQQHKLQAQQYKAEAQIAKREADITRREAELERQTVDRERELEQAKQEAGPHLSPTAIQRLESIKKHVDRLTKKATTDYNLANFSTTDQKNWAANQALQNQEKGLSSGTIDAGQPLYANKEIARQAQQLQPATRPIDRWLTTGEHPKLQGNWFNRNITQRAMNLARPLYTNTAQAGEHWQEGRPVRAAGRMARGVGGTALGVVFPKAMVIGGMLLDDKEVRGPKWALDSMERDAANEMEVRERARAWTDREQGLKDRYAQNVAPMNTLGPKASLQALNMYGPYANLTLGANRGPALMGSDYNRSMAQRYGDPDTMGGSFLNAILPMLSGFVTGAPNPSYQNGEPLVPGEHLRHVPGGIQ